MKIANFDFAKLIEVVPQQYGEAIQLYPWIKCESHEWDNRTTIENAIWLIRHLTSRSSRGATERSNIPKAFNELAGVIGDDFNPPAT